MSAAGVEAFPVRTAGAAPARALIPRERFCALAREAGTEFVIAPVVEPAFNRFSAYAQGADREAVDRQVRAIAGRCGATFVPRERFRDIEAQDLLFRDFVHLYDTGRDIYTPRLGEMIMGR